MESLQAVIIVLRRPLCCIAYELLSYYINVTNEDVFRVVSCFRHHINKIFGVLRY